MMVELQVLMLDRGIDILCMQETHRLKSEYFVTEFGCLIILSGSSEGHIEHAGVGFIIAPRLRRSIEAGISANGIQQVESEWRPDWDNHSVCAAQWVCLSGQTTVFHRIDRLHKGPLGPWNKNGFANLYARIYRHLPGEHTFLGSHIFLNSSAESPADANRHLMAEICVSLEMVVANTCFSASQEGLASCYKVGSKRTDQLNWATHSQIDFVLCDDAWLHAVENTSTDRWAALASHHFLMTCLLSTTVPKSPPKEQQQLPNIAVLKDPYFSNRFAVLVDESMETAECDGTSTANIEMQHARLLDVFFHATEQSLPSSTTLTPRRPWISQRTLTLIKRRQTARSQGDDIGEKLCTKRSGNPLQAIESPGLITSLRPEIGAKFTANEKALLLNRADFATKRASLLKVTCAPTHWQIICNMYSGA